VFHSKQFLYGPFVWAHRALSIQKRRFPARAVLSASRGITTLKGGWMVARYAQAAAWPGVMMMVKSAFMGNGLGTAVGLIST
jgi:hypothetical protein